MFFTTAWYYIFCLCNLVLDEILSQGPIFSHSKIKQQTNPENWSILQTHFKVNYLGIISLPGHGLFAVAPSTCTEAGLCVALLEEPHLLTVPPPQLPAEMSPRDCVWGQIAVFLLFYHFVAFTLLSQAWASGLMSSAWSSVVLDSFALCQNRRILPCVL